MAASTNRPGGRAPAAEASKARNQVPPVAPEVRRHQAPAAADRMAAEASTTVVAAEASTTVAAEPVGMVKWAQAVWKPEPTREP